MSSKSSNSTRIMFIDDDADNANYNCIVFQEGAACLDEFRKNGADIVITDLNSEVLIRMYR